METRNKLLLVGGGGHCRSIIDSIQGSIKWNDIKIIDNGLPLGYKVNGYEVIGDDSQLEYLYQNGYKYAFVSLGSVGNTSKRRSIYSKLKTIGFNIPSIIDSSANVSKNAIISEGVFIGKSAIVNTSVTIGICAIINTGSIIEHDCLLGDFVHISPGSVLSGSVIIGSDTHIGSNSSVKNDILIGSRTLIGIGSVVVKNIESDKVAYGNPCKEVIK